MKIKPAHYEYIKSAIANSVTRQRAEAHKKYLVEEDKRYTDLTKRLVFDFAYMAGLTSYICDNIYSYANDEHLFTAYKKICNELGLI